MVVNTSYVVSNCRDGLYIVADPLPKLMNIFDNMLIINFGKASWLAQAMRLTTIDVELLILFLNLFQVSTAARAIL